MNFPKTIAGCSLKLTCGLIAMGIFTDISWLPCEIIQKIYCDDLVMYFHCSCHLIINFLMSECSE